MAKIQHLAKQIDFSSSIAFSQDTRTTGLPKSVRMLFVPVSETFNDFSYRVRATVGIRNTSGTFEWVNGFLAFKGVLNTQSYLATALKPLATRFILASETKDPFATMLKSIRDYQQFVRLVGKDEASLLADAAHDAAYLHNKSRPIDGWQDFEQSDAFNHSFARNSESVFAFENGGSVLYGLRLDSEDSRQDFVATVNLKQTKLVFSFEFKEGPLSENRIAVVIGRNGLGKTASLLAISEAMLGRTDPIATLKPLPRFNKLLVFVHSRTLSRFNAASKRQDSGAAQRTFSLDPTVSANSNRRLTNSFARIVRESDYLENPLNLLAEIITIEFRPLSLLVPILPTATLGEFAQFRNDYAPLNMFTRHGGEQTNLEKPRQIDLSKPLRFVDQDGKPRRLSLGQDVFFTFVINAIANAGSASSFLIDEPENFFHPNLVSKFVRVLHQLLTRTKSIAIVATHSPYVVREVPRSQVHVLNWQEEMQQTLVERPRMQTFGASVSHISDDIFDDTLPDHLFVELLRRSKYAKASVATMIAELKDELSVDALMRLRAIAESENNGKAGDFD